MRNPMTRHAVETDPHNITIQNFTILTLIGASIGPNSEVRTIAKLARI
jgi:hypothetical protein